MIKNLRAYREYIILYTIGLETHVYCADTQEDVDRFTSLLKKSRLLVRFSVYKMKESFYPANEEEVWYTAKREPGGGAR